MRNWLKQASVPVTLLLGLVLVQAPMASETNVDVAPGTVDFRMAPLEQAKKINLHLRARFGAGETLTVMTWDGRGDGHHLILPEEGVTPAAVDGRVTSDRIDSVSWFRRARLPMGSCDSQQDCEDKMEEMCKGAGHDGVKEATVTITIHADGSKTCSGDCDRNGAVAFVTCNPR
jgi:hypothetical protein